MARGMTVFHPPSAGTPASRQYSKYGLAPDTIPSHIWHQRRRKSKAARLARRIGR